MTTTTITQALQGVATRLQTITGLRAGDIAPDQINPPHALVSVASVSYRQTMGRAKYDVNFTITLLTSAASDRAGQRALLAYADPRGSSSVIVAIEGSPTLGGLVDQCVIDTFAPLGLEEVGALNFYGGRFDGRLILSGT